MTTAIASGGLATPLAASAGEARAEHSASARVLASDAASHAAPLFTLPSAEPVRRPVPTAPEPSPRPARVHRLAYGRLTLDELVSGAWAAVGAGAPAACPLCDGALRPRSGDASLADCDRCSTELA